MRFLTDPHRFHSDQEAGCVMARVIQKTIFQLVAEYSDAVGRFGPDSPEVWQIRSLHADNAEFLGYADALDRIKRHLGGSGIEQAKTVAKRIDVASQL